MGNLCSRSSNTSPSNNNFSTPGRTLSSAPSPSSRSQIPPSYGTTSTLQPAPQSQPYNQTQPPQSRPLGPSSTQPQPRSQTLGPSQAQDLGANDPRTAAAAAAEARANASKGKGTGKLGKELQAQRQQTRTGTLGAVSEEERRRREVEGGREVVNYN